MKKRGIGIACMVYPQDPSNPSSSTGVFVKVNQDGTAVLYNGSTDLGQGSDTVLVQIASEILGIPVEEIRFITSDTDITPYDEGTGASRTTYIVGSAVKEACEKARGVLYEAAAKKLGFADSRKFYIEGGNICLDTFPDIFIPVKEAAYLSERVHGFPVLGMATYATLSGKEDEENGHCRHYEKHIFATQIAEVDVDTETGEIELLKLVAVHDCGRAINPMMVEGQIQGGVAQGIGYALMEELIEDAEDGRLLTNNFAEYHIPTAMDMPREFIVDYVEIPHKNGAFGAGGVSEPTAAPTAGAIANAVADALGFRIDRLPLTPERVLLAIYQHEMRNKTFAPLMSVRHHNDVIRKKTHKMSVNNI
jgi:CO/xanthine dehydrogenase Mo-binding subunit